MIRRERLPSGIRERLPRLAERFRGDRRVVAVYLFGSFARGEEGPLSDIDVALLLDPATPRGDFFGLTLEFLGEINHLLETDEVGFVLLNEAPLTLRHEIVRSGRVLLDNDGTARLGFEVRTEELFLDFKPFLDAYDDALLADLAGQS